MLYRSTLGVLLFVAAIALVGGTARSVSANNLAPFETVYGTDYVSAGYGGMRGIGTGTIHLTGVSGTVTKALLFWQGPTNSIDPTVNASVNFNGTAIQGTNIGFSSPNCWSAFTNSQGYRADVTSLVAGNGDYALSNFTKPTADINGASLLVFFNDGNPANNRDIVLFDGNDSNAPNSYDANGWNVSLPGINYSSGSASLELHVSDGQTFPDAALVLNGQTLVPAGAVFQGDSVPNGASASSTSGGLWDIKPYDVTSFLTPGPNTITLTTGLNNDCLSLIVAVVNLPAGAAPGQPTATPGSGMPVLTATPTSTPAPKATPTSPPASTPTPANTVVATQVPPGPVGVVGAGARGPAITAPNTGTGASAASDGTASFGWLALLAAAGIATLSAGATLALRRRQ